MTSVGKHFFMADYGGQDDRPAHLDAAFASLPSETDHDTKFEDLKNHPQKAIYAGAWMGIRTGKDDVLDRSVAHSNHLIRSMAIRSTVGNDQIPWLQKKKIGRTLADDHHPYVVGQVVKFAPSTIDDQTLNRIAEHHPDATVRAKAAYAYTERHMFKDKV